MEELLYVERPFYSFITDATDIAGNVGSVQTIIELIDVPNLPPTFTRAFGVQRYFEKVEKVNMHIYFLLVDRKFKSGN